MLLNNLKAFQKSLLSWYQENARDLPWRETKDPYKIWVSEIMLQQTQVDTVKPYYKKWIKRFPTLKKLATAPESDVMNHWAGLGYYRRARMLHDGAKAIVKNSKGRLPETAEELMKIPGIGRYTAGAIASIAFESKVPILDGNVIRILTRLLAIKKDVSETKTLQHLWDLADTLLPNKNLGDFNQALMELGALICSPEGPACLVCPVSKFCEAKKIGKETLFPVKGRKEKIESIKNVALILKKQGKVFIRKQPKTERWGGLWMFPYWQEKKEMLRAIPAANDGIKKRLSVKHGFTKYRIQLDVYECLEVKRETPKKGKWVPIKELKKYPFPSPHQKIVGSLTQNG